MHNAIHFFDMNRPYTLDDFNKDIKYLSDKSLESNYIVNVIKYGESVKNRPLYAIKIWESSNRPKPSILILSLIHGREVFSVMHTMKTIDELLYSYYGTGTFGDYNVKEIIKKVDVFFVPVVNPDGWAISLGVDKSNICDIAGNPKWWKANANGIDLNSNFEDGNWKYKKTTSLSEPASEGFYGFYPESEPEVKFLKKYVETIRPTVALSYHTSGNCLYWADCKTHDILTPYDLNFANALAEISGYEKMPISSEPSIYAGGFENWFRKEFQRPCICVELSPSPIEDYVQHNERCFQELVWTYSKKITFEATTFMIKNLMNDI